MEFAWKQEKPEATKIDFEVNLFLYSAFYTNRLSSNASHAVVHLLRTRK